MMCDFSVIVPVYNEEESVRPLVEAVHRVLATDPRTWELIFVDDGSTDATPSIAADLAARDPRVRLVQLGRNYGQTTAMMAGFDHARGRVMVSMDGDLQNDPADIPVMIGKLDEGFDLVAGWRRARQDKALTRKLPSWVANRLIGHITGIPIKDNGCSLKAFRRDLIQRLTLYSDMHRFIPAFASLAGARIAQIPVRHHARRYGTSKYGLGRTYRVLADLVTLQMLMRFRERPLLGFACGAVAAFACAGGFAIAWVVALTRFQAMKAEALILPSSAFVWLVTAVFLLMLGFVAEAVVRQRGSFVRTGLLAREWHGAADHS